jgi:hypothetical protein
MGEKRNEFGFSLNCSFSIIFRKLLALYEQGITEESIFTSIALFY